MIKSILLTLVTMVVFYCNANVSAQQIFEDSGQRLGNSCSWDVKLGDLDGDGDLDAVVANYDWVKKWDEKPTQKNEIWLNNSDGTFAKSSQVLGSPKRYHCMMLIMMENLILSSTIIKLKPSAHG